MDFTRYSLRASNATSMGWFGPTVPGLVKAVEKGYTFVKIHEVWHFPPPPPEQRRTGLFADYVNTWLKLKQESAGWPSWCQTVEQKREYILRYKEREGIRLDISQIAKTLDKRPRPS